MSKALYLTNFLVVLGFNAYWLFKNGAEGLKEMYDFSLNKYLTVCAYLYAIWGLGNLFLFICSQIIRYIVIK